VLSFASTDGPELVSVVQRELDGLYAGIQEASLLQSELAQLYQENFQVHPTLILYFDFWK